MATTIGRIPLWIIGTVIGIIIIGLLCVFVLWFIFRIGFILVVIG